MFSVIVRKFLLESTGRKCSILPQVLVKIMSSELNFHCTIIVIIVKKYMAAANELFSTQVLARLP